MRSALVDALASCVDRSQRGGVLDFLQGLACDELAYIADFLGACILESTSRFHCSREQLAMRVAEFERSRSRRPIHPRALATYQDHRMILLLEYLCRGGLRDASTAARAAGHA